MAVLGDHFDPRVVALCKERGIRGPDAFARKFGRRLRDISAEKALRILHGEKERATANFPDRFAPPYPERSRQQVKDEMRAFREEQVETITRAWRERDESNGLTTYRHFPPLDEGDGGTDGGKPRHPDRPIFGQIPESG